LDVYWNIFAMHGPMDVKNCITCVGSCWTTLPDKQLAHLQGATGPRR